MGCCNRFDKPLREVVFKIKSGWKPDETFYKSLNLYKHLINEGRTNENKKIT